MERASPNFSHTLRVVLRRRFQPPLRLARALLNSAAPVLKDRFAPSRRNCTATHALIGGGASLRVESLPSRPLSFLKRTGGKKVRVFKNQCALPQERERAEKEGEE
jgi:hypothetical protein